MAASELFPGDLSTGTDAPFTAVRRLFSRALGWKPAVALAVVGLAVIWVGLAVMTDANGLVRAALALIGFAIVLAAIGALGRLAWGPTWDVGFWGCSLWLALLVLGAAFADLLPLGEQRDTALTMATPGNLRPDLFSSHPLGTNNFSLDLLARCLYGARVSLLTSLLAVALGTLIGSVIGVIAGYYRGATDSAIGMLTDTVLAFPALVLLVALAAVIGLPTSVPEAILKSGTALAAVSIPAMVRLARANTLVQAQREFVLASRALGARRSRVIFREIYPNVLVPVLAYSFVIMAVIIVAEGSLSFLGLGLQPPEPTWGNMIAEGGVDVLRKNPHIVLVPGAFMFLTVYSLNRVGEHARAKWSGAESKL